MSKTLRIGTRNSELALWQANQVKQRLEEQGFSTELVPVKSIGDRNQEQPLYEMGITGIFTRALDVALINDEIDLAVHSMKDVPTDLPQGVVQAAVLPRTNTQDILVHHGLDALDLDKTATVATGSLRRKAQWLNRYPNHRVVNLRGNVNTRLRKLDENDWEGAIFAAAGLERVNLKPENFIDLDWMLPAPAQGAMVVVTKEKDATARRALELLNHRPSEIRTHIERQFLNTLEGGCTAPIGASATIDGDKIFFEGAVFSLDGKEHLETRESFSIEDYKNKGKMMANSILSSGGRELMEVIKKDLPD